MEAKSGAEINSAQEAVIATLDGSNVRDLSLISKSGRRRKAARAATAARPTPGEALLARHLAAKPGLEPARVSNTGEQRDTELLRAMRATGMVDDLPGTPNYPRHDLPLQWDRRSEAAACLCADGTVPAAQMAAQIGVPLSTISAWRAHPSFRRRVSDLIESYGEKLAGHVLSSKAGRTRRAMQLADALAEVREQRAASAMPELYNDDGNDPAFDFDQGLSIIPGGRTGLMIRTEKVIGTGALAKRVVEYAVDFDHVQAEVATMQYIARESGQWSEKTEVDITRKLYIGVDIDLL